MCSVIKVPGPDVLVVSVLRVPVMKKVTLDISSTFGEGQANTHGCPSFKINCRPAPKGHVGVVLRMEQPPLGDPLELVPVGRDLQPHPAVSTQYTTPVPLAVNSELMAELP